jgi:hypothetical protein
MRVVGVAVWVRDKQEEPQFVWVKFEAQAMGAGASAAAEV